MVRYVFTVFVHEIIYEWIWLLKFLCKLHVRNLERPLQKCANLEWTPPPMKSSPHEETDDKLMHLASNALLGDTCASLPCLPSCWVHEQKTCQPSSLQEPAQNSKPEYSWPKHRPLLTKSPQVHHLTWVGASVPITGKSTVHKGDGSMRTARSGGVEFKLRPNSFLTIRVIRMLRF